MQWNTVTPFSKFVALALFVALPFVGFCLGIRYGEAIAWVNGNPAMRTNADYYSDVAAWLTDARTDAHAGFGISHPIDFETDDIYAPAPSTDWRIGANGNPGFLLFTLTIPRTFEPQTNFGDAKLTIGTSRNAAAAAECVVPLPNDGPQTTSTATIGGTPFYVSRFAGAGAGNYYETTSYRTLRAGACWAIEYTVHSSQIANYPPEYGLKPFDRAKLTGVLDRIVRTFKFL